VYCLANIERFKRDITTNFPAKRTKIASIRGGVLPDKKRCTPRQEIVYPPTNLSVLPNKWARPISLQTSVFSDSSGTLPVFVVYIVVYIFKQQVGEREMPTLDE
jgi:hypothetical protein